MPLFLAVVLSLAASLSAAEPAIEHGRKLFNESGCRACHSVGGAGGDAGPDLTYAGFRRSPEFLDAWLAEPRAWKHDTLMPSFKLSQADRMSLVAYLASLRGQDFGADKPWDGAREPGKMIFARAGCVACHGPAGRGGHPNNNVPGGVIPALPALVATYNKDELQARIRSGRVPEKADPAGPAPLVKMPAWGEVLSDAEISAVADYLLTLAPKDKRGEW